MKIQQPSVYLDHMLKQTRMHHVQLSSMADMKANMLLTTASVVITLSIRYVVDPQLKWASLIMIAFCLATIVLATYAAMPKIPFSFKKGEPGVDPWKPGFNLLFFGDFARLTYPEYEAAMEEVMNDPARTYEAQIRDVYTLGRFLATKKYRYVRLAYLSFIAGLILSGTAFFLSGILD